MGHQAELSMRSPRIAPHCPEDGHDRLRGARQFIADVQFAGSKTLLVLPSSLGQQGGQFFRVFFKFSDDIADKALRFFINPGYAGNRPGRFNICLFILALQYAHLNILGCVLLRGSGANEKCAET